MIAVFDIDGVLADATQREHHLAVRPKDWDAFFAEVGTDTVIEAGRQRFLAESAQHDVVLLSGRPERCRADTEAWLSRNGMSGALLLLRPDSDRRPAAVLKADLVRGIGTPAEIALIIDDDESVIRRLKQAGYHTVQFPQPLR